VKRLLIAIILATALALFVPAIGFAQDQNSQEASPEVANVEIANLMTWFTAEPRNWTAGALFAASGLVGALVTMYTLINGTLPGVAGQAKIDHDAEQLTRLSQRLEELSNASKPDWEGVQALERMVNNLRDDLRTERRWLYAIAAPLYLIAGTAFATALAQDIFEAVVIGAGWTTFLGTFGLKRDYKERKEIKDDALNQAVARVDRLTSLSKEQKQKAQALGLDGLIDDLERDAHHLKRDASVAKAM
jgi:hypothetical protein